LKSGAAAEAAQVCAAVTEVFQVDQVHGLKKQLLVQTLVQATVMTYAQVGADSGTVVHVLVAVDVNLT
jgi:hypothetical protein